MNALAKHVWTLGLALNRVRAADVQAWGTPDPEFDRSYPLVLDRVQYVAANVPYVELEAAAAELVIDVLTNTGRWGASQIQIQSAMDRVRESFTVLERYILEPTDFPLSLPEFGADLTRAILAQVR